MKFGNSQEEERGKELAEARRDERVLGFDIVSGTAPASGLQGSHSVASQLAPIEVQVRDARRPPGPVSPLHRRIPSNQPWPAIMSWRLGVSCWAYDAPLASLKHDAPPVGSGTSAVAVARRRAVSKRLVESTRYLVEILAAGDGT